MLAIVISRWSAFLSVDALPQLAVFSAFIREVFGGRSRIGDFETEFWSYSTGVVARGSKGSMQKLAKNLSFSTVPDSCRPVL